MESFLRGTLRSHSQINYPPSTAPKVRIHHPLRHRRITHDYLAYGEELTDPEFQTNNMKFTGHERDPEASLDYMLARYYSAGSGRMLQVDPVNDYNLTDPMSFNKYSYVRGNPIMGTDPTGMASDDPRGLENHLFPQKIDKAKEERKRKLRAKYEMASGFTNSSQSQPAQQQNQQQSTQSQASPSGSVVTSEESLPYWQQVKSNFVETNKIFPKSIKFLMGVSVAGQTANTLGLISPGQWAAQVFDAGSFGGATVQGVQFTALETLPQVALNTAFNFAIVTVTFEAGVGVGSMLQPAIQPAFDSYSEWATDQDFQSMPFHFGRR